MLFRPDIEGRRQGKLLYYPETDSLFIEFTQKLGAETREVADGLNVDLDANGQVADSDMDFASRRFDLTRLETVALPLSEIAAE